ncbi:CCA-adding enzyme [Euphorbia peplus]|nr:CCA-adding enzyme [Euphorbia peplus]
MAMLLKYKNSLSSPIKTLTTFQVQRLTHTLTEPNTQSSRKIEGYDYFVVEMSKWKKIQASRVGVSPEKIPLFAWSVLNQLHKKGFQAYLVGGCVRDFLLNKQPKDFDVVTTAELKEVKRVFRNCSIIGRRFPICRVKIKDSVIEVSSFETVAAHFKDNENQKLPEMPVGCDEKDFICWNNSIRRDFTINSLFYDPFLDKICDYANGMEDIRTLKLRTVKPAHLSFEEDRARVLRGLRIAGRLGLSISVDTELAICKFASSVKDLDKFRIMMELNYMLSYGAAESTIYLLQRFNILELFLPFQAGYLNCQFRKISPEGSVMLMKLFFNLDKLVSCNRPCHPNLWLGLLAFHQALVIYPQDAFVVWVFASVLYHGTWKEGVKFARENANLQVDFVPEISGFSESKSDDELSEEVSHLAALVQKSVGSLVDANILAKSMCKYKDSSSLSGEVLVSKKAGDDVAQLFNVLVGDIESYKHGRQSYMINYNLLGKGFRMESRFVLGKIILGTLSGGLDEDMEPAEENEDTPWKQKVQKLKLLSEGINQRKEVVVSKDKSQKMPKKPTKVADTNKLTEGESTKTPRKMIKKQTYSVVDSGDKIEREIKPREVVKEKSNLLLLSSLFRR